MSPVIHVSPFSVQLFEIQWDSAPVVSWIKEHFDSMYYRVPPLRQITLEAICHMLLQCCSNSNSVCVATIAVH